MLTKEHVRSDALATKAIGAFSNSTVTIAEVEQPLSRFNTVIVYSPGAFTLVLIADGVVPAGLPELFVHANEALPAFVIPESETGVKSQLINEGFAIVTVGG